MKAGHHLHDEPCFLPRYVSEIGIPTAIHLRGTICQRKLHWLRRKAGGQSQHVDAGLALPQSSWRPRSCFFPIVRWPMKAASASGSPASLEAWRPHRSSRVGRWRISTTIPPSRRAPTSRVRVNSRSIGFRATLPLNANLNLNLNAIGNLGFVIPSYVFATPVLGGQASVSLMAAYGVVGTSLAGTLSGVATGRRSATASLRAVRQHQRHDMGLWRIWRRCSN